MRAFTYTLNTEPNPRNSYEQRKASIEQRHHQMLGTAHNDGSHRSGLATVIERLRADDIDVVLTIDHAPGTHDHCPSRGGGRDTQRRSTTT